MENGEQEFLDNVVRVITSRKGARVVCLVYSDVGMELVLNTMNLVEQLGMLDVARLEILERHARFREEHEEEIRRAGMAAVAVLGTPGKVN
jgi:hypothetical protein